MNDLSDNQADLNDILPRIGSQEQRDKFLRSQMRVRQFQENDEFLAIVNYLENFAVLINALTKDAASGTNDTQLPTVPGNAQAKDHVVHFNEMAAAFERLTKLVQSQQAAFVTLAQNDDNILRKVHLFVEGQTQFQLARWTKWAIGGALVLLLALAFCAGRYMDASLQAREAAQSNVQLLDALRRSSNANLTTVLRSAGGDIAPTRIAIGDGRTVDGILVTGGKFKLDQPTLYTDNSVRIPLRQ